MSNVFSSPTNAAAATGLCSRCTLNKLDWVQDALAQQGKLLSPLHALFTLQKHAVEVTPTTESLALAAYRGLLAPMPMSMLMDKEDAKLCLQLVSEKVVTRAAKRKLEAEALEAQKEEASKLLGEQRMAFRAAVANRPAKTKRVVDNCGRVTVF